MDHLEVVSFGIIFVNSGIDRFSYLIVFKIQFKEVMSGDMALFRECIIFLSFS